MWSRSPISPSSVAGAAPSPPGGRPLSAVPMHLKVRLNCGIAKKVSAVRPPSSVASRHLPPRRGRLLRRDGCMKWFLSPISPSSVAGATPSPPGGRLFPAVQIFYVLLLNHACKSALYLMLTNHRGKPSPGWGRWREATDEGETGERTHITPHPQFSPHHKIEGLIKVLEDS